MFTQCPKCETVFRLSAEVLRSAGGQVRCGRCGDVFNALARLAEEPDVFEPGESPLDLEARADHILESAPEDHAAGAADAAVESDQAFETIDPEMAPGTEIAQLVPLEEASDRSLEFTLPADDLDRIFVEAVPLAATADLVAQVRSRVQRPPAPEPAHELELHEQSGSFDAAPTGDAGGEPDDDEPVDDEPGDDEPGDGQAGGNVGDRRAATAPQDDGLFGAARARTGLAPAVPAAPAIPAAPAAPRIVGFEVPEQVRQEMIEQIQRPEPIALRKPRPDRGRLWAWSVAAVLLALLLAGQLVDQHREALASHQTLGPALRAIYSALGAPLPQPVDLSAYQLRQWGVSGDPAANDTLRVRAAILNTATTFQAFPLLRVSLTNRFGSHIGSRDFGPTEYLGKPTARRMAPGERADATLDIQDPGKTAEGFEIDICLRDAAQRLTCANDTVHAP
jgi:predicted Zn finger-like uncharacterized protein